MATLTFCGESYTVDHAVKGADYVHGYNANGVCVVAFEDVADLTAIEYDGEYLAPEECATEVCNKVVYCGGKLKTLGGALVINAVTVELTAEGWTDGAQSVNVEGATGDNSVIVSPVPESRADYSDGGIYCAAQSTGVLTFQCESAPAVAISVNVLILP